MFVPVVAARYPLSMMSITWRVCSGVDGVNTVAGDEFHELHDVLEDVVTRRSRGAAR